jgi:hypothetical protein
MDDVYISEYCGMPAEPTKRRRTSVVLSSIPNHGHGGGIHIPSYRSMKRGVNIDYVEVDTGMEMRRLKFQEPPCQVSLEETYMFCFHVRSPPDAIHEEKEDSFTISHELSFEEPMQEIHIRDATRANSEGMVFTLRVYSFIPATNSRKHGILWCTM